MRTHIAIGTSLAVVLSAQVSAAAAGPAIESAELLPVRDASLVENADGALANGAGQGIFCGRTGQLPGQAIRRALLDFDVASVVPAGSTITSVTLQLRLTNTVSGPQSCSLHRVLADWSEGPSLPTLGGGGVGAPSEPGDATWLHRSFPSEFWATPGGDFDSDPSATTSVIFPGVYQWTSSTMVDDVQAWVDGTAAEHGWMLIGQEGVPSSAKRFGSRESTDPALRPVLLVEWTESTPCPADLDDSGTVGFEDLLALLGCWGPVEGKSCVRAGSIAAPAEATDLSDLLGVLAAWGPCAG